MLDLRKRRQVKALLRQGHSRSKIARVAGISLSSVKRIAKETEVPHLDDAAERRRRRIGRPSWVQDFRNPVERWLRENPRLKSVEILRRARLRGYTGGKTAMYSLVAKVRAELTASEDGERGADHQGRQGAPLVIRAGSLR